MQIISIFKVVKGLIREFPRRTTSLFAISIISILTILMITLFISSFNKKIDKDVLSDLGGVFSVTEKELDFRHEISAMEESVNLESNQSLNKENNSVLYDDTLIGWGLKRNKNNQPPEAVATNVTLLQKYGGFYIGDTSKKEIYLTFDEGYENGYTAKILDVLGQNRVKGVFFITGPYLNEHQDLVRRMVEEGHEVGNHTVKHPSLPTVNDARVEEELLGLDRAFYEKFGKHMKYLRPPKGEFSERTLAISQKLGYRNAFWSFAYDDWYVDRSSGADFAYNKVMENLHNGGVILLHAVSKDNVEALDSIIKGAREKGYEFGNIDNIK